MTPNTLIGELRRLLAEAEPEDLPDLLAAVRAEVYRGEFRLLGRPQMVACDEGLLTMKEAAEILAVPETQVREMGRRGQLPVVPVGRYRRISKQGLSDWIRTSTLPKMQSVR